MKVAKYRHAGVIRTGTVADGLVQPCHQSLDELVAGAAPAPLHHPVPLDDVELLAPITTDCRGLICTGINYVEHQRESAAAFEREVPAHPIVFFKTPSAVADPDTALELDRHVSAEFDWEVELGVVIGRGGRHIDAADAHRHVYGYTVVNDVSARDVQQRHRQWHLGKNVDRATPVGPWIVTADELGFPPQVEVSLTVNGVEKQRAHTRDMIFGVAELIAVTSRYVALRPGDVLATGTPSGVGFTRTPPEYLIDGDVMVAAIEGIGELRSRVHVPAPVPAVV